MNTILVSKYEYTGGCNMAIIKCPECGKEISDKADRCISCGYPIQQFLAERDINSQKQDNIMSESFEDTDGSSNDDLQNIQQKVMEKYNKKITTSIISSVGFALVTIWDFYLSSDIEFDSIGLNLMFVVCGLLTIFFVVGLRNNLKAKRLAESNIQEFINSSYGKEYKNMVETEARLKAEKERRKELEESKRPVCPVCGSKNTRRLTTTNRAVSIAVVGLASDKIGKQYECLNCKHKW